MRGVRGAPMGAAMMGLSCLLLLVMVKAQLMELPPGLFPTEPSPWPVQVTQPDGDNVELFVKGSPEATGIWLETAEEYTVVEEQDEGGQLWYSYAQLNNETGDVGSIPGCHPPSCTSANLKARHIPKRVIRGASRSARIRNCGLPCQTTRKHQVAAIDLHPILRARKQQQEELAKDPTNNSLRRRLATPSKMKNLVVLLKFNDHQGRSLPSVAAISKLMNGGGAKMYHNNVEIAPTGSIRDVYSWNSYGQFDLESTVYPWVVLPENEAYYAGGNSGFSGKVSEAIKHALDEMAWKYNLAQFDSTGDGFIDAITILHSGYGAEWNGATNRIWSHKWALMGGTHVADGKKVYEYHISPAIWSTSGSEIGRIGVIAHETGHFLGLPDLYDGSGGQGIGSWGLMGNSWGFDGSQLRPPYLSPWSKIFLGWMNPTEITSGSYNLEASFKSAQVFKVKQGYPNGEYLLIENRYAGGIESYNPGSGMVVWHIDESASDIDDAYPGNGWPGRHYRVAVVAADGQFDLEKGTNRGDVADLFRPNYVNSVGKSGFPNICRYDRSSCPHEINGISASGEKMSFTLNQGGPVTPKPTESPTKAPTAAPTPAGGLILSTPFTTDNYRNAGIMFDIEAQSGKSPYVFGISMNIDLTTDVKVHIYSMDGTHMDALSVPTMWDKKGEVLVTAAGAGKMTFVKIPEDKQFKVSHGSKTGIYVTLESASIVYSVGTGLNNVDASDLEVASDDFMILYQGTSISISGGSMEDKFGDIRFFKESYLPRKANVAMHYVGALCQEEKSTCNDGGDCCSGTCVKTTSRRRRRPRRRRRRRRRKRATSSARLLESEEDDEDLPQLVAATGTCS